MFIHFYQIEYPKGNNAVGGGEPISLENFMEEMKAIFVEGLTYSNSKLNNAVQAERVPPIIAPSLRSGRTFNTEMEKKSVYLKGKFFEKDKIIGKFYGDSCITVFFMTTCQLFDGCY